MINAYDTLEYENCDDSGLQSLVDNLFPDQGPDLKAYKFVFKDGNHYVSSWTAVQVNNNIYIEVPEGDLPAGSRECFVALLEYSEESLGVNAVFLCVPKRRVDSAELLRTFMFIGFEVVHHSTCPTVPAVDEYILMAYSFD